MDLRESLNVVLRGTEPRLATRFYEIFFARNPEAVAAFKEVNLRHQKAVLTMTIQAIVEYYQFGFPAMRHYLQVLGHKHMMRKIPQHLYPKFREALLAALSDYLGPDWTEELEKEWTAAIDRAVETMLLGYVDGPLFY